MLIVRGMFADRCSEYFDSSYSCVVGASWLIFRPSSAPLCAPRTRLYAPRFPFYLFRLCVIFFVLMRVIGAVADPLAPRIDMRLSE